MNDRRKQGSDGDVLAEALNLIVGYGDKPVLNNVSFTLKRGHSLALVGTNGCGKSTLLKTLVGLIPSLEGSLNVDRSELAYLGQFHAVNGLLPICARDVVKMARYKRNGLLRRMTRTDRDAVNDAMERTGVGDLAERPLRALSGGQRQRVFLAQALAREAALLVLDEPTAGLDAGSTERYLQIVSEELARGAAVITATHDIAEALRCNQAMLLAGRVVANGDPRDVLSAERLLEAFGIALHSVPHGGHHDLVVTAAPHAHVHEHSREHSHER
jgi:ABC-type Mn2+/Zn2+ transport system ATPase subunit